MANHLCPANDQSNQMHVKKKWKVTDECMHRRALSAHANDKTVSRIGSSISRRLSMFMKYIDIKCFMHFSFFSSPSFCSTCHTYNSDINEMNCAFTQHLSDAMNEKFHFKQNVNRSISFSIWFGLDLFPTVFFSSFFLCFSSIHFTFWHLKKSFPWKIPTRNRCLCHVIKQINIDMGKIVFKKKFRSTMSMIACILYWCCAAYVSMWANENVERGRRFNQ